MGSGLVLSAVPLADANESLLEEWRLLGERIGANVSLLPAWVRVTAASHGVSSRSSVQVVRDRNSGRLRAVFPVVKEWRDVAAFRISVLELIPNFASCHHEPISDLTPEETLSAFLEIAANIGVDCVHFGNLLSDSDFAEYLGTNPSTRELYTQRIEGEESPFLSLQTYEGWEELLATKPKKFRYKLRKRAERLEKPPLRMRWFDQATDCDSLLDLIERIERQSWKEGQGLSIHLRPTEVAYHRQLLPLLCSLGSMVSNVLYHENDPIAYSICSHSRGWVGQLKTSFDSRYAELSPGGIVIDEAIRMAIQRNAEEFDFLGSADQHKLAWSKTARSHTSYFVFRKGTPRGFLVGIAKALRGRWTRRLSRAPQA